MGALQAWTQRLAGERRTTADVVREVAKSDDEWRRDLTKEQFRILRRAGTERPFSGPDVEADHDGYFRCGGCAAPLFDAATKFESGTGWPSFSDALAENVERHRDFSMGMPRTEVRCRRCGGHLGHVFGDGPAPTRQRYCINAGALVSGGREPS